LLVSELCNKQFALELVDATGGDRRIQKGFFLMFVTASVNTLGLPLVTLGKAPGCTDSLVNIGATVHDCGRAAGDCL
jgi:hypothetical protein